MYRNTPHGKPQWSRPVYPDMTPENIIWKSFLGEAPQHDFDANRYINWRFFWDYSGGNVYENMCHQLAFWYKVMNLQIPEAGHHDRRHLPVEGRPRSARHHERRHGASRRDAVHLGLRLRQQRSSASPKTCSATDGTISNAAADPLHAAEGQPAGRQRNGRQDPHAIRDAHMQNFLDCIRVGQRNRTVRSKSGFRVSIACRMAVESYRQQRSDALGPAGKKRSSSLCGVAADKRQKNFCHL